MSNNEKPHISSIISNWVQIIGIILAGGWAFYTFVYLEIYLPSKNVSHFRIDITLGKAGESNKFNPEKNVIAVLAILNGTNTSKRKLSIVSGYLEIWGDKITDSNLDDEKFTANIPNAIEGYNAMDAKYFAGRESELLFVGSIFKNWSFEPGESNKIYRMIYLPKGIYDHIEAAAWVLSGPISSELQIKHIVKDKDLIEYTVTINEKGKEVLYGQDDNKFKELVVDNEIGKSSSNCYLSLWDTSINDK